MLDVELKPRGVHVGKKVLRRTEHICTPEADLAEPLGGDGKDWRSLQVLLVLKAARSEP